VLVGVSTLEGFIKRGPPTFWEEHLDFIILAALVAFVAFAIWWSK
jgi:hypothetical protein